MNGKFKKISNIAARKVQKYSDRWARSYWHKNPFCEAPKAVNDEYHQLWQAEKTSCYPLVDALEAEIGFAVDRAWLDTLALHTQIVIKSSPLCYQHGRILYSVLCQYLQHSTSCLTVLETGTARGFSAVVMARALDDMSASGKILTFDVLPHTAPMYWNCIDDMEGRKSRKDLLRPWANLISDKVVFIEGDSNINLDKVYADRIHFAFLDGAHSYRDVMFEFRVVAGKQLAGDVIVFDDYNERDFPGLIKAVDEGCVLFGYDKRVIDLGGLRRYVIATKSAS